MTETKTTAPKKSTNAARTKVDTAVADAQNDVALALDAQHAEKVARQNARFAELGKEMSGDK